jgi:AcrR family transcriptional regulator
MTTETLDRHPAPEASARERLLLAADRLFYEEGIHSVGIDRVIEQAGVAKASLYKNFGSKDELVRAYLDRRHAARQRRINDKLAGLTDPGERILAVFDVLADISSQPGFRGCAFVNASAEAPAGSSVAEASANSRAWVRSLFVELALAAKVTDPDELAARLVLLYDGATVGGQMDHDATAAVRARAVAKVLVDATPTRA